MRLLGLLLACAAPPEPPRAVEPPPPEVAPALPAAPLLTPEAALAAAPGRDGTRFDPSALIRAVNALQPLGPDGARALLATATPADPYAVVLVARLLWPAPRGSPGVYLEFGVPRLGIPRPSPDWPLLPLVLADDVPFLLSSGYHLGGSMPRPGTMVDEIVQAGRFRSAALAPANPAAAADSIVARGSRLVPEDQRLYLAAVVYRQALRAVSPADTCAVTKLPAELVASWAECSGAVRAARWQEGAFR